MWQGEGNVDEEASKRRPIGKVRISVPTFRNCNIQKVRAYVCLLACLLPGCVNEQ